MERRLNYKYGMKSYNFILNDDTVYTVILF